MNASRRREPLGPFPGRPATVDQVRPGDRVTGPAQLAQTQTHAATLTE